MKRTFLLAVLLPFLLTTCASSGAGGGGPSPDKAPVSAGAAQAENPFYSGSGGSGLSIAILPPQGVGLPEDLAYLPALVQGEFVSNFSGYSAIRVLDRVTLDDQFAELQSGYYLDDAEGVITLGHLPPTTHIMMGRITKTATGYTLQITVAKTADGATEASYSGTCTVAELDNFTGIRRSSLELLGKMRVELTERSRTELAGAAAQQSVNAQTALAQGITAQRGGTEVAALTYFNMAASFDTSLQEAASRASVMTANISSGNIGADVRNDIQWRRDWITRLTETEQYFDNFFKTSSPPFVLYYGTTLERGSVNYQTETLPLSFEVNLHTPSEWFTSVEKAVQALVDGLNATERKQVWGIGEWPKTAATSLAPFSNGRKNFSVVFELVNDQNRVIGRQTVQLGSYWQCNIGNSITIDHPVDNVQTVTFDAVKADDLTDTLSIRIAGVNGADPQITAQSNNLQIISVLGGGRNSNLEIQNGVLKGFIDKSKASPNLVIHIPVRPGEQVTSIGEKAFERNQLTSVVIPNSVTSIGEKAFERNQLTSVVIPNSLTSIGESAFANNRLTSVVIPNSLTSIRYETFARNQLTSVVIPNSVTSIEMDAFLNNRLASVVIPNSVTGLHFRSFADNQLTTVTIGANVVLVKYRKYDSIGFGFESYYKRHGKKAGTYTRPDAKSTRWSFTPQ
ncbi:hypothetical protein AGMMS49928_14120 [Spirochaetia bacterium]|nr:hypothetical protein AGMMS49928_14120 [Spirochaetia bacterium]